MFGISILHLLLLSFLSGVIGIYIINLRDTFRESSQGFFLLGTMSFFAQIASLWNESAKKFFLVVILLFPVGWVCAIIALLPRWVLKMMKS